MLQVVRVAPEHFWRFSRKVSASSLAFWISVRPYLVQLFDNQNEFFDVPVSTLTPLQVREKLADIAALVIPEDKINDFKEQLQHPSQGNPNGGVAVTNDLKYTSTFGVFHIHFFNR